MSDEWRRESFCIKCHRRWEPHPSEDTAGSTYCGDCHRAALANERDVTALRDFAQDVLQAPYQHWPYFVFRAALDHRLVSIAMGDHPRATPLLSGQSMESPQAVDAVDPSDGSTGKPSTRAKD